MTLRLHLTCQNAFIRETTDLLKEVRGKYPLCTAGGNIHFRIDILEISIDVHPN